MAFVLALMVPTMVPLLLLLFALLLRILLTSPLFRRSRAVALAFARSLSHGRRAASGAQRARSRLRGIGLGLTVGMFGKTIGAEQSARLTG